MGVRPSAGERPAVVREPGLEARAHDAVIAGMYLAWLINAGAQPLFPAGVRDLLVTAG